MTNIKNRKKNLSNLFSKIDTEEKAYWLGFLYADGCIYNDGIRVALSVLDEKHIKKLDIFFNNLGKISYLKEKPFNSKNQQYICKAQCVYNLYDVEALDILSKYGFCENKTENGELDLSLIPFELEKHFWRGMIDGDGTFYYAKNKISVGLTNKFSTLLLFKKFLETHLNITANITPDHSVFRIRLGANNGKLLSEYLYKNCKISLDRKQEKANLFILKNIKYSYKKVKIFNSNEEKIFNSIKECSDFLKVSQYFIKTKNEINGWKIMKL